MEGIASGRPAAERAAQAALGSAMAEAAPALFGAVLAALEALTDRRDHDALSPDDIKIFQTPLGACLLIQGLETHILCPAVVQIVALGLLSEAVHAALNL